MITERLIQAINNGIREHYGLAPKFIAMNRKNYESMKNENKIDAIGIEKGIFFGIPIRITETEKEFELKFYVDPIGETK